MTYMEAKSYVDSQGNTHTDYTDPDSTKYSNQKIGNTWIKVPACWRQGKEGKKAPHPTPHAKNIAALLRRTVAR